MPDHLHLVLEALTDDADMRRFMDRFKQATGFWYRRDTGRTLWQSGYLDWVLRSDEATVAVCRYVLENPVRAGFAAVIGEYPFAGSDVYPIEELVLDLTPAWKGPRRRWREQD